MLASSQETITVADLGRLVKRSVHSIQQDFRDHRGCTPTAFLRARRLLARQLLLTGPDTRVSQVALACGFRHLGRFSVAYRQQFGETPSRTRRRSQRGL